jgi:hypothetical protein
VLGADERREDVLQLVVCHGETPLDRKRNSGTPSQAHRRGKLADKLSVSQL